VDHPCNNTSGIPFVDRVTLSFVHCCAGCRVIPKQYAWCVQDALSWARHGCDARLSTIPQHWRLWCSGRGHRFHSDHPWCGAGQEPSTWVPSMQLIYWHELSIS